MNMQPYYIPYPASYYNHEPSQRPVIHSDNLVKIYATKVVSSRLVTDSKEEIAEDAQAINGATS